MQRLLFKGKGRQHDQCRYLQRGSDFVERTNVARNGDMVVALVDDSATVKTFYKEQGHVRLQPENDTMDPIIVDDCDILGKVFGVFRLYR